MGISVTRLLSFLFMISLISCKKGESKSENGKLQATDNAKNMETFFVGTYTKKEGHVDGQADGIYAFSRNPETGIINSGRTVAEIVNPSFVKSSPNGEYLFAVSELGSADASSGFVYSFKILPNDSLQQVSRLSTESFAPAHIEVDQTGKFVFVSNYMGGVVMMYTVKNDGSLAKQQRIDLENPDDSHAHSVTLSRDNKKAYVADLGNDKIWIFDFNADEGTLEPNEQPSVSLEEGAGPRHFTFSQNGKFAYSVNELNSSVTAFKVLENGGLEILQNISSLPEDFEGKNSTADIHLHPSGKFLYVSNRGHNSIASFEVDGTEGTLSPLDHFSTQGETPRNFALSPSGEHLYVANQDSNSIVLFLVDRDKGTLSQPGISYEVMTPVSIEIVEE